MSCLWNFFFYLLRSPSRTWNSYCVYLQTILNSELSALEKGGITVGKSKESVKYDLVFTDLSFLKMSFMVHHQLSIFLEGNFWPDSLLYLSNLQFPYVMLVFILDNNCISMAVSAPNYEPTELQQSHGIFSGLFPHFHISIKSTVWKINQSANIAKRYGPCSISFF